MPWSVVATHRQAELWACANLDRLGFATFLPTRAVAIRDRRSPTSRPRFDFRPLFTSYAFVSLEADEPWTPARYAPGVRDLLSNGQGRPQYVPAGTVEALQATEAARRTPTTPQTVHGPGAPVTLAGGAFGGLEAVVLAVQSHRARVAIVLFGHLREVWVPWSRLISR